jgi:hypothetical protein
MINYQHSTRDSIVKLLSEDQASRVSAPSLVRLSDGDEYLNLEQLDQGVQQSKGTSALVGCILPRRALTQYTWSKIMMLIGGFSHRSAA